MLTINVPQHGLVDHTDPTKGFRTPSRKKDYEASEDEDALKLWHLGAPFLDSKPRGATRPPFDQAKEAKIQMIAKKIKAGIEAKTSHSDSGLDGDVPPTQDSKPDNSLQVVSTSPVSENASVVVTPDSKASSTPSNPPSSGLTGVKAELTQLVDRTMDSLAKLLEGRGDLSMDGEVLDHVQVKPLRLRCLLYLLFHRSLLHPDARSLFQAAWIPWIWRLADQHSPLL